MPNTGVLGTANVGRVSGFIFCGEPFENVRISISSESWQTDQDRSSALT